MSFLDSLNSPLGPLKAWQWGVIGGAGVAILLVLRGRGQGGGQEQGGYVVLPVGTGKVTTPPAGFGSFGGLDALTSFLCKLPNAPNQFALAMPDGSELHFSNGQGTFGSTATVIGQGQSATGINFNPCQPAIPPPSGGGGGGGGTTTPRTGPGFEWYLPREWLGGHTGLQSNQWAENTMRTLGLTHGELSYTRSYSGYRPSWLPAGASESEPSGMYLPQGQLP
jgi:hypothetical protein